MTAYGHGLEPSVFRREIVAEEQKALYLSPDDRFDLVEAFSRSFRPLCSSEAIGRRYC